MSGAVLHADQRARRAGRAGRSVLGLVLLVVAAVTFVGPILWMVVTSLKSYGEATAIPPTLLPADPTAEAYAAVLSLDGQYPVLRWFLNSLLAATLHTALVLVLASCAAYALARLRFRGRRLIFAVVVGSLFVPSFVFLTPNYLIVDQLGWLDTLWAVVVPGAADAFGVFFLRQFFVAFPEEIEEAAALDGANQWQVFTSIVLPNAKPALVTLALLSFLGNWNDYVWPVYALFSPDHLTLPAGLKLLQGAYLIDYPPIMAGAFIASVPVIILFVVAQRYIIAGVARSGLKG